MFSCLRGKDGGTDHDENSSSTESALLISDKSDKSQDRFREVRHKKKKEAKEFQWGCLQTRR